MREPLQRGSEATAAPSRAGRDAGLPGGAAARAGADRRAQSIGAEPAGGRYHRGSRRSLGPASSPGTIENGLRLGKAAGAQFFGLQQLLRDGTRDAGDTVGVAVMLPDGGDIAALGEHADAPALGRALFLPAGAVLPDGVARRASGALDAHGGRPHRPGGYPERQWRGAARRAGGDRPRATAGRRMPSCCAAWRAAGGYRAGGRGRWPPPSGI